MKRKNLGESPIWRKEGAIAQEEQGLDMGIARSAHDHEKRRRE